MKIWSNINKGAFVLLLKVCSHILVTSKGVSWTEFLFLLNMFLLFSSITSVNFLSTEGLPNCVPINMFIFLVNIKIHGKPNCQPEIFNIPQVCWEG